MSRSEPDVSIVSAGRPLRAYLGDRRHIRHIAFVGVGGYGVSLALWAWRHREGLGTFLFENQLPEAEQPRLWALLLGVGVAFVIWLLLGWFLAGRKKRRFSEVMNCLSAIFLLSSFSFLLIVLSIKGIETDHIWLTYSLIASMAWMAYLALAEFGDIEWSISHRWGLMMALAFSLVYALFMSWLMLSRHAHFLTHAYDLGIQDQAFWTILKKGYPLVTLYGPTPVNQFGDHFTPIYYLLTPLYAIIGDARALLLIQSFAIGLAAVPVYLLSRRLLPFSQKTLLALVLTASFLLHPALQGVSTFDFHEIALAPILLLWAFYFMETRQNRLMVLFLALAMLTKEEVSLSIAAIGLYLFLIRRERRTGLLVMTGALVYFFLVNSIIMPALGGGPDLERFADLTSGPGVMALLKGIVGNPVYTFSYAFLNPEKLAFLVALLLPVVFLPLGAGWRWLMAIPAFSVALLSSTPSQYTLGYHYPAIMLPFVYYLAAATLARIRIHRHHTLAVGAAILVASLMMNWQFGWLMGKKYQPLPTNDVHSAALHELIEMIPPRASVNAMSDLVPHVSAREQVYLFPDVYSAEYILFDSDARANFWPYRSIDARGEAIATMLPYLESGEYGVVQEKDRAFLFKRGYDTSRNDKAIATLFSPVYPAQLMRSAESTKLVSDPEALFGEARVSQGTGAEQEGDIGLLFGPYVHLWPGKYQIVYRLKLQGAERNGRVATVDVFSHTAGGPLAGMDLDASQFDQARGYQEFVLDLNISETLPDVEFRVLHSGLGTLYADSVRVIYLGQ